MYENKNRAYGHGVKFLAGGQRGNIGELVPYSKKPKKNKQEPARSLALQCTSKPRVQHVHADTT